MLVSVAILGILAALSYGAYSQMLGRSHLTTDSSKLRQIGIALSGFVSEHHGRLPHQDEPIAGTGVGDGDDRWNFYESVDRYLPKDGKYNPRSIYNYNRRDTWYATHFDSPVNYVAFVPNPYIFRGVNWQGRMVRVPSPANTVVMAEANNNAGSGRYDLDPSQPATHEPGQESFYSASRPGQQGLYLFGDFHVEAMTGDQSEQALSERGEVNIWRWW